MKIESKAVTVQFGLADVACLVLAFASLTFIFFAAYSLAGDLQSLAGIPALLSNHGRLMLVIIGIAVVNALAVRKTYGHRLASRIQRAAVPTGWAAMFVGALPVYMGAGHLLN